MIEESLKNNLFIKENRWFSGDEYLASNEYQNDSQDHLHKRLHNFRNTVIPWLINAKPLFGSKILEIGCGTSSSMIALAEQVVDVTAIDIIEKDIVVAKERSKLYGLNAKFFVQMLLMWTRCLIIDLILLFFSPVLNI